MRENNLKRVVQLSDWEGLRNDMRWHTKTGVISLRNMKNKHILNCLSLIKSRVTTQNKWWGFSSSFWILCLNKELKTRTDFANKVLISWLSLFKCSKSAKDMCVLLKRY